MSLGDPDMQMRLADGERVAGREPVSPALGFTPRGQRRARPGFCLKSTEQKHGIGVQMRL